MSQTVAIVGAGLVGRLLAVELATSGWDIHVYERDGRMGWESCSFAAAGMLAPYCELESAELLVSEMGVASLARWPSILERLKSPVSFRQEGSLLVAHPRDFDALVHLQQKIEPQLSSSEMMQWVGQREIADLEPEIVDRFQRGLFFPGEGQIDNHELMASLAETMEDLGVEVHWRTSVEKLEPHQISYDSKQETFDWVVDCRGLGAKEDWKGLRGVRGELVIVRAPDVTLKRPVRVMHPRYPLYVVPRKNNFFVIGATSIDSEDMTPISLRSTLELLSAAYALHPGFAEARILHSVVQCRPALPDHLPQIQVQDGLMRINGLYRHGFLCSPAVIQTAVNTINAGESDDELLIVKRVACDSNRLDTQE